MNEFDEEKESFASWLARKSAYDKANGIRRTRFAEYSSNREWPPMPGTIHACIHLISQRGKPPEWRVGEYLVPLLDFRDVYVGEDLDEVKTAWLKATGKQLFETRTGSVPGFWRRHDVPVWLCGDNVDIALRAIDIGQDWTTWNTNQWVAHIWPKKWTMRLPREDMQAYRVFRAELSRINSLRKASRPNLAIVQHCDTVIHFLKPEIAKLRKRGQILPP